MTADDIIAALALAPHPEGGWFREILRLPDPDGGRDLSTTIHFLLKSGEHSHWHRVDADEQWIHLGGAALTLSVAADDAGPARDITLSPLAQGGSQTHVVPAHHWQAARSQGAFTLVACTVAPGFRFEGFELAAPGFDIPRR